MRPGQGTSVEFIESIFLYSHDVGQTLHLQLWGDWRMRAGVYVGCGGGAGLLSLALELFLSEELGPVTIIRAHPSPGYAGDWVKLNWFFLTLTSRFTELPLNFPLPFPLLGTPSISHALGGTVHPMTQPSLSVLLGSGTGQLSTVSTVLPLASRGSKS